VLAFGVVKVTLVVVEDLFFRLDLLEAFAITRMLRLSGRCPAYSPPSHRWPASTGLAGGASSTFVTGAATWIPPDGIWLRNA